LRPREKRANYCASASRARRSLVLSQLTQTPLSGQFTHVLRAAVAGSRPQASLVPLLPRDSLLPEWSMASLAVRHVNAPRALNAVELFFTMLRSSSQSSPPLRPLFARKFSRWLRFSSRCSFASFSVCDPLFTVLHHALLYLVGCFSIPETGQTYVPRFNSKEVRRLRFTRGLQSAPSSG